MIDSNTSNSIGKGSFEVTIKHSPLTKDIINKALNDVRPSGMGRYYSVKKGQFDSAIEWGRGVWLYDMQRRGVLSNLSHHSIITFTHTNNSIRYEADFTYYCNNILYIEDVKPGKFKKGSTRGECVMVPANEYIAQNKNVKTVVIDSGLHRINFLLTAASLNVYAIPIIGTASFFRGVKYLSLSYGGNID